MGAVVIGGLSVRLYADLGSDHDYVSSAGGGLTRSGSFFWVEIRPSYYFVINQGGLLPRLHFSLIGINGVAANKFK